MLAIDPILLIIIIFGVGVLTFNSLQLMAAHRRRNAARQRVKKLDAQIDKIKLELEVKRDQLKQEIKDKELLFRGVK